MKFGVFGILVLVFCSCVKNKNPKTINSLEGTWGWISTTQDSTFYEDTASSSNSQLITIVPTKNIDWKRNDSTFFLGVYSYVSKTSIATGNKELVMRLGTISLDFVINRQLDTLWLQEDNVGGKIYKYIRN